VRLVAGRDTREGRILRHRLRYVAVDDGTENRVRAWLLEAPTAAPQGSTARAQVSPRLRHVKDFELVP
jgi:hypothetical protein